MKNKPKNFSAAIGITFFTLLVFISYAGAWSSPLDVGKDYTPMADIVDIVRKSDRFDYHTTYLDPAQAKKQYEENLKILEPGLRIAKRDNKEITRYHPPTRVAELINEAENSAKERDYDRALEALEKAKTIDPGYSPLYSKQAEIYLEMGKTQKARKTAEEAIEKNPLNFEAYRVKAECLMKMGKLEEAKDSLVLALIYNRNHPGILKLLQQLGDKLDYRVYTEPFIPLYTLQEMDNGKVRIYIDKDQIIRWMPYSFCKAVWRYEPGYFQKKMGEEEYHPTTYEEMECAKNMLWAYEAFRKRGNFEKDSLLERMKKIESKFFLREFVYFEIIAPRNPEILLTLDQKHLADMVDYVNEFVLVQR